jgi:hypothetical protein
MGGSGVWVGKMVIIGSGVTLGGAGVGGRDVAEPQEVMMTQRTKKKNRLMFFVGAT